MAKRYYTINIKPITFHALQGLQQGRKLYLYELLQSLVMMAYDHKEELDKYIKEALSLLAWSEEDQPARWAEWVNK
jgi:hypothetical protein